MRNDEIREMGRLLDRAQGLDRALEAPQQIHERARDQELRREILPETVPPALAGGAEADQRELMGVERILHAEREEVIDQHIACRRDPQADDVVNVETVEGRAVDA